MSSDKELALLEDWIRRIKIEYEIYFAGGRKTPPYDLKNKIESTLKRFFDRPMTSYSERYRFTTLSDRYHVYRDLWRRQLQRLEEQGRSVAQAPAVEHTPVASGRLVMEFRQPDEEATKIERLYDFYCEARRKYESTENSPISLDQFRRFVTSKTEELKRKYGTEEVAFQVKVADGLVKVTAQAKPARKQGGEEKGGT